VASYLTSDGVELQYDVTGAGHPLVLVHGGATTRHCFDLVVDGFAKRFTVVRYDRRGHGESGDGDGWTIDREADDLIEVAAHVGGGEVVSVLGYSFGGTVALHAAARLHGVVDALVVYEPPLAVPGLFADEARLVALLEEGRRDEAARYFFITTCYLRHSVVEAMERHPQWRVTLSLIHNLRREVPAVLEAQMPEPSTTHPPVAVVLTQPDGNPAFADIAAALHTNWGAYVLTVPGLPHLAMSTEPDAFVDTVVEHLLAERTSDGHDTTRPKR
jgi:pimeloyl-ACP methyl ester carboxylesterase